MSVPNPTPNNLTLVRFGPLSIDFTDVAQNYTLGQLDYDEQTFIPTAAFVEFTNNIGAFTTAAAVTIDNGTDNENIVASTNLVATVLTPNNSTANLSNQILSIASPAYVLGQVPASTAIPSNGAAATQSLRVKVTTSAVPTLTSQSRYTANNISTINVSSLPASYTVGSTVRVKSATTAGYNGVVTIISTTSTSFSYYNPSITTDGTAGSPVTDTSAKIGACTGSVYVVGLLQ